MDGKFEELTLLWDTIDRPAKWLCLQGLGACELRITITLPLKFNILSVKY